MSRIAPWACAAFAVVCAAPLAAQSRAIAITIDDLPAVSTRADDVVWRDITTRLVGALVRNGVPATGFVIGSRLVRDGERDPARIDMVRHWIAAGLELGNHSYSHRSLHDVPLAEYRADVLRGDASIREVLAERGLEPRWYRHPYLHTGRDLAVRDSLVVFLADHGYRVAPVTYDNADWQFARAYDRALDRGDEAAAMRIADSYVAYMDSVFGYYEAQSRALLGSEPPQVLLLHANRLNAGAFDRIAGRLRARDYAFVTLEEAVRHPAYRHADAYDGPGGITWLHRWALTEGRRGDFFAGEPTVPRFVADAAEGR